MARTDFKHAYTEDRAKNNLSKPIYTLHTLRLGTFVHSKPSSIYSMGKILSSRRVFICQFNIQNRRRRLLALSLSAVVLFSTVATTWIWFTKKGSKEGKGEVTNKNATTTATRRRRELQREEPQRRPRPRQRARQGEQQGGPQEESQKGQQEEPQGEPRGKPVLKQRGHLPSQPARLPLWPTPPRQQLLRLLLLQRPLHLL